MGRGSICTWQDYGRRNSTNMQQFSSSRAEFMTDDIQYKRRDGWFLSYPKLAAVIVVFIIGVTAAGFIGWYINFLQNAKSGETRSFRDDIEENEIVDRTISPFVRPLKYNLNLTLLLPEESPAPKLKGRVIIEFRVEEAPGLNKLFLSGKNITVAGYNLTRLQRGSDAIGIDGEASARAEDVPPERPTSRNDGINILRYDIDDEKELHTIYLEEDIAEGNYTLEIDYEVSLDTDAFYVGNFSPSDGQVWLMATRLQPSSNHGLFPVFDTATSKSLFSVSVARPKEMRVLSNMPLRTSRDTTDQSSIATFDETPLLAPWNLALAIGRVDAVRTTNATVPVTLWSGAVSNSEAAYLIGKLESAVINLIEMFSMPFPMPKLDLLSLPSGIDENIGKPGLISLKQSILRITESSPLLSKSDALKDLVRLLGQHWLGGAVNMNRTDSWLLDGVLGLVERQLPSKIDPSLVSSDSFVAEVQAGSMELDGYTVSRSLEANLNGFYDWPFSNREAKGACLIRMLHGAINETTFANGCRSFVARWKYDTANATEFWDKMQEGADGLPAGVRLAELMAAWISEGGYPVVSVTRNRERGTAILRQQRFSYDASLDTPEHLWHIPLTYTTGAGNWSEPRTIWFETETEISLDELGWNGTWILFNVNKTGYYRVHYDEENWQLLKSALEGNPDAFPPETKASLIDDVFSLAAVGLASYEAAFDFIKYMRTNERHYAPWGALMRQLFKLNRLLYESSAFTGFQEFMLKFVSPLYDEMKFRLEEGPRLALLALRMACAFEHSECLDWFKIVFANLNANVSVATVMPSYIHETFYCTVARYGTRKEWNYFTERASAIGDAEEKKHLLSSLSCFQAPWILQTLLNEILHGKLFTEEEALIILSTFPQNPAAAQASFKFVRTNWPAIVERFPKSYALLKTFAFSMFHGLTTEDDINDLQEFRENNIDIMTGAKHATALVEANANFVTTWLKYSLPEIEKLLESDFANGTAEGGPQQKS